MNEVEAEKGAASEQALGRTGSGEPSTMMSAAEDPQSGNDLGKALGDGSAGSCPGGVEVEELEDIQAVTSHFAGRDPLQTVVHSLAGTPEAHYANGLGAVDAPIHQFGQDGYAT